MSLRIAIARWLAPDAFERAERYVYLRSALRDARRWLGYEFPEVDEAITWAMVSEKNYYRGLDEAAVAAVPGKPWIHDISDFREHLRAKRAAVTDQKPITMQDVRLAVGEGRLTAGDVLAGCNAELRRRASLSAQASPSGKCFECGTGLHAPFCPACNPDLARP